MKDQVKSKISIEPDYSEALDIIREGVNGRRVILLVGSCSVNYEGRAASKLGLGERIIIIKNDGAVLVHRPLGYEPVNWQPEGSVFKTEVTREGLVVEAIRKRPREKLRIIFDKVILASNLDLRDEAEFFMYASEKDMQKAILKKPSLIEPGLRLITYEKKVEPGFVDVYGIDRDGRLVVIEIKRKTAGRDAALQLANYVKSIKATSKREVRGIIVAPNLARGTQKLCAQLNLEYKPLEPKKCIELLKKRSTRKILDFLK